MFIFYTYSSSCIFCVNNYVWKLIIFMSVDTKIYFPLWPIAPQSKCIFVEKCSEPLLCDRGFSVTARCSLSMFALARGMRARARTSGRDNSSVYPHVNARVHARVCNRVSRPTSQYHYKVLLEKNKWTYACDRLGNFTSSYRDNDFAPFSHGFLASLSVSSVEKSTEQSWVKLADNAVQIPEQTT